MLIVPTCGFTDHVTAVLVVPATVAVNCTDWAATADTELADIEMLTFEDVEASDNIAPSSCTVAVAVLLGSATLVAEIVTKESLTTVGGAV